MKTAYAFGLLFLLCLSSVVRADSIVVFNEVMYHPSSREALLEWVELHNQMAVDMDLSRWSLDGGIQFSFPEGTLISAGGHLVIASNPQALATNGFAGAMGPFTGRLGNSGDSLKLINNSGRLMDELKYSDGADWPLAADGAGPSLAKRDPQSSSQFAANWTSSILSGGTPGRRNFPSPQEKLRQQALVGRGEPWRYEASGRLPSGNWTLTDFNDIDWVESVNGATLIGYWPLDGDASAVVGESGSLINDPVPSLDRNNQANHALAFDGAKKQRVQIPGGGGLNGRSSGTISLWVKWTGTQDADCCLSYGAVLSRHEDSQFSDNIIALNRADPTVARVVWRQSGRPAPVTVTGTMNVGTSWHHVAVTFAPTGSVMYIDGRFQTKGSSPVLHSNAATALSIGGWADGGDGYASASIDDVAIWDAPLSSAQILQLATQSKTPLAFATPFGLPPYVAGHPVLPGVSTSTELPLGALTYYFRKKFVLDQVPEFTRLVLEGEIDDGAIFYLNGTELHRVNLPNGAVAFDTLASSVVGDAPLTVSNRFSPSGLVRGTNILAAEIHQAMPTSDPDLVFDATLTALIEPADPSEFALTGVRFNEITGGGGSKLGIELINTASEAADVGGFIVAKMGSANREFALPALRIPAGGLVVLSESELGFGAKTGDRLFLYKPAKAGVIDAVDIRDSARSRWPDGMDTWVNTGSLTLGASNQVSLHEEIVINEIMYHPPPRYGEPAVFEVVTNLSFSSTWKYEQSGIDLGDTWREPNYDDSAWPSGTGLFYSTAANLPAAKNTPLNLGPKTYYFRTPFVVNHDPSTTTLILRHIVDDGVVVYVNGVEVNRQNMPTGAISYGISAAPAVGTASSRGPFTLVVTNLHSGTNFLAAEVHQAQATGDDVVFGAELSLRFEVVPEVLFQESKETWVELYNRSSHAVDLTGWRLDDGIDFRFAAGTTLGAGAYLVVASEPASLLQKYPGITVVGPYTNRLSSAGERLLLRDGRNNVADQVTYFDNGRWPEAADGGGASLELRNPDAENSVAESWAASDESSRSPWRSYSYRGVTQASAVGPDGQWKEFVMGMLQAGTILIDDVSVIETPSGTPIELIQNGGFQEGIAKWRVIGSHHGEVVEDPDQPGNKVLRLMTVGGTEHMSNHAETTLANNRDVANNREYQISFRAKWISGTPQLHTRLYFNRLPRTTLLAMPSQHGTPGRRNSTYVNNTEPVYRDFHHDPVVPPASQPVTVSVRVSDPDGVAEAGLWWAVDGGAWTRASMTLTAPIDSAPIYVGTIPGQSASSIVQFYVESADALGAISTFPARGRDSRALYKVEDGSASTNGLHTVRLVLTPADATLLHTTVNLMSNDRLGCTMIYDERDTFYDVGVRLKGSEHSRTTTPRLGFDVELTSEKKFRGVHRRLGIDRSESVDFGQREMLVHAMINHAGGMISKYSDLIQVITPRKEHTGTAELQLQRYYDDFLDSQYPHGSDGMEFEYELVYQLNATDNGKPDGNKVPAPDSVVGTDIRGLGDDKENYRWTFLIKNNESRDDYSRLIPFAKAMGLSGITFSNQISQVLDVDECLRAFAVCTLAGCGDNYGADGSQHNAIFYFRPSDQRALFLPHDLDAFFDASRALVGSSDLQKIINFPVWGRSYYRQVQEIIDSTYNGNYMTYWAKHYGKLLPAQPFASHLDFIKQRASFLQTQLRTAVRPVGFSITNNNGADFLVTTSSIVIVGNAWIDVADIRLAGAKGSLPLSWITTSRWQTSMPLILGANRLEFVAYNVAGTALTNRVITITSTAVGGGVDTDLDGIPDVWENVYGLDPSINDAGADLDGDGLTNAQEYLSGTDPRVGSSVLKLAAARLEAGGVTLSFDAIAGRSYGIEYKDDLSKLDWSTLSAVPAAQTNHAARVEDVGSTIKSRIYRLRTP